MTGPKISTNAQNATYYCFTARGHVTIETYNGDQQQDGRTGFTMRFVPFDSPTRDVLLFFFFCKHTALARFLMMSRTLITHRRAHRNSQSAAFDMPALYSVLALNMKVATNERRSSSSDEEKDDGS